MTNTCEELLIESCYKKWKYLEVMYYIIACYTYHYINSSKLLMLRIIEKKMGFW